MSKPSDFAGISEKFARAKKRGREGAMGRKEMETECNTGAAAKLKA